MQTVAKLFLISLCIASFVLFAEIAVPAQSKAAKTELYQAQAYGQGSQTGRTYNVSIYVYGYSPDEDQEVLLDAFKAGGHEAVVNALSKMRSKGRIAITGTVGYDILYIRQTPIPNGRKIRMITNRPSQADEVRTDSSSDFDLFAIELNLSSEKGKSTGTLLPRIQFKVGKDRQIDIAAYQNPWKLTNIVDRSD